MDEIESLFKEFIGDGAEFVSGIMTPATPDREVAGRKVSAMNAKLRMSFVVGGKHHRVVIERFPDVLADEICGIHPSSANSTP